MRALAALLACACAAACASARPAPVTPAPALCEVLLLLGAAEPFALAADPAGGVAVAGKFSGTVRAGGFAVSAAGGADAFVLRTNADGSVRWLHRLGGTGDDAASAVAIAPDGDVIAAGVVEERCFAARLSAGDGHEVWASRLEGAGESSCRALALDARGDAWAAGSFSGALKTAASNGQSDLLVVKFAGRTGEAALVRAIGGKGRELGRAVLVLPSGSVLVAGQFGGDIDVSEAAVDFGQGPVASAGGYDGFLLQLAPDGRTQWVTTSGDNGDDGLGALATGPDGAIFASGHHQPAGSGQGLDRRGEGNSTGIVLRTSREGRGEWVRIFEGPSSAANHLAFDDHGRLWTAGASKGIRLGAASIEAAGGLDGFALAFDPATGEPLGSRRWGTPAQDLIRGLARIPGGLALTGLTGGELIECGKPVGSLGEQTAFVLWLRDL